MFIRHGSFSSTWMATRLSGSASAAPAATDKGGREAYGLCAFGILPTLLLRPEWRGAAALAIAAIGAGAAAGSGS
jgi:hypothetical protein